MAFALSVSLKMNGGINIKIVFFMTYYYNGFDITCIACNYYINGIPYPFATMEAVKKHIDWIKERQQPTKATVFSYKK